MSELATLVVLATSWGTRFGGINAFNVELVRSLGIMPRRHFELVCVVPSATEADYVDAGQHHVQLLSLGLPMDALPATDAPDVLLAITNLMGHPPTQSTIWIGHDDKTGPIALALREATPSSRVVLIHHMAFAAYQDHKKGDSAEAAAKVKEQRDLFSAADACLAVGPMLQDQLTDLLSSGAGGPPIEMVVPGLAEPDPELVAISDRAPRNFSAFLAGRLGGEDERIKQAMLGIRAFGAAIGQAMAAQAEPDHPMRLSPILRMRGVPTAEQDAVRQALQEAGGHAINCELSEFNEDRVAYFRSLATSSVAMMPSWHEGFGLTAWEAIACQVPVVIGEQSGVYRLLNGACQGMGLQRSVHAVAVQGRADADNSAPAHSEQDVICVRDALLSIGRNINQRKAQAVDLATLLRRVHDYTWKRCASDAISALEQHLGANLRYPQTLGPSTTATPSESQTRPSPSSEMPSSPLPAFLRPPEPRPWQASLGLAPSRLLRASDQVVPFHSERQAVVEAWLSTMTAEGNALVTLQLVTGPGGIGKTRSALEFLKRARVRGWLSLWLPAAAPDQPMLSEWRAWLAELQQPAVLVIDYAEGRQDVLLQWLAATYDTASKSELPRVHILCLARRGSWWSDLTRHRDCTAEVAELLRGPANFGAQVLPDWTAAMDARLSAYRDALDAYSVALGIPTPSNSWEPDLSAAPFRRPLYLHLAALAALDGQRPAHAHQLLSAQLDREWRHWRSMGKAAETQYGDWADSMAWVALVQGATREQLGHGIRTIEINAPELVPALCDQYDDGNGSAAPLEPDLLAEALLIERLGLPRGGQVLASALSTSDRVKSIRVLEVLSRLLDRHAVESANDGHDSTWTRTILGFLAHAWPSHAHALISVAHAAEPSFSKWLETSWRILSPNAQELIARDLLLPHQSAPLTRLSVEIARAQLRGASSAVERAAALNHLGIRLASVGDWHARAEALECAQASVRAYEEISTPPANAHTSERAGALLNLSNRLAERGDLDSQLEAIKLVRAAVALIRFARLSNPSLYGSQLSTCLTVLSNRLSDRGDSTSRLEALKFAREAVEICRENLKTVRDASPLHELAVALNNLSVQLHELGDAALSNEALDAIREATAIYRQLVTQRRNAFLPNLAFALNNLGNQLARRPDPQSRAEALKRTTEARELFSELSNINPAAYKHYLAGVETNLASAIFHAVGGSSPEALTHAANAVSLYRDLAAEEASAYNALLAQALANLANHRLTQQDIGLRAGAIDCARESVQLFQQLEKKDAGAHRLSLARALRTLANCLLDCSDQESRKEAVGHAEEALVVFRGLAAESPSSYLYELATALNNLGNGLSQFSDPSSQARVIQWGREEVAAMRSLANQHVVQFTPALAMALSNLANSLIVQPDAGSRTEAIMYAREAVDLIGQAYSREPETYAQQFRMAKETLNRITSAASDE